jgi:PhoPQ-activated pathogenicity-related protein
MKISPFVAGGVLLLVALQAPVRAQDAPPKSAVLPATTVPENTRGESVIPDGLFRYLSRPEPDYRWTREDSNAVANGQVHRLKLVSQKWQDIVWQHNLMVYEPEKILHPRHMLLFVTGGRNGSLPNLEDMKI